MPSVVDVDQAIMSLAQDRWLKVARIVATVCQNELDGDLGHEFVAQRIAFLVEAGRLELQGDLSNWRHSEIRRAG